MPKFPHFKNPYQDIVGNMKMPGELQRAEPVSETSEAGVPGVQNRTEIYTYFTVPDGKSQLLYSAQKWVKVQLTLETAGPVAVSTRENVSPVLSGKGILLTTGREVEFTIPKGNRLFIAATSINRVSFIIESVPWLQSVIYNLRNNTSEIVKAIKGRR